MPDLNSMNNQGQSNSSIGSYSQMRSDMNNKVKKQEEKNKNSDLTLAEALADGKLDENETILLLKRYNSMDEVKSISCGRFTPEMVQELLNSGMEYSDIKDIQKKLRHESQQLIDHTPNTINSTRKSFGV